MRPPLTQILVRINELPNYLETAISYPVDRETAIERVGDVELECPDRTKTTTIAAGLNRTNEEIFSSTDELYHAILGSVDDAYIGRKYYDDRGTNPHADGTVFATDDSF